MTTPAPPAPPAPRTTATGRLGNGELRRLVAHHLADHPADAFTPGEIARALGRSAGATGNALTVLAGRGEADREPGKPARYRANSATDAATRAAAPARRRRPARPAAPAPAAPAAPAVAPPAPAAARPARAGASPAGIARPGGQVYHARTLADRTDVDALRDLRAAGIPALLYGPPGTGKTSLVEAAFPDVITIAGDGDTTTADFVGDYTTAASGTGYEWVPGPLITAMTEGRPLFIDDATLIPAPVLAVAYPAMDGRGEITVKAHRGEKARAAAGFYVIAGHNPGVHGAILSDALASRFSVQVQVSTDYDLAQTLRIDTRAIRAARRLAALQADGETSWAPQLRELIAFQKITRVLGEDAAIANLAGVAPAEDREAVTEVITRYFGRTVTPLALGRQA
jgi:nitric oxide reductase NorQ protein